MTAQSYRLCAVIILFHVKHDLLGHCCVSRETLLNIIKDFIFTLFCVTIISAEAIVFVLGKTKGIQGNVNGKDNFSSKSEGRRR